MSIMKIGQGALSMGGQTKDSSAQSKHQIGFGKSERISNQTFKSGGPIRATGAILESMDKSIHTSG